MTARSLLIAGATGLVGREVLAQALAHAEVSRVVAVTRRPLAPHARLENPVVDFAALDANAPWWRVDAVVCALGTTIKQAGSQDAFRAVDLDLVRAFGQHARAAGATSFALNSALGAEASSRNFYLRTKGQAEAALRGLGFPSLTLVRPSLLLGDRAQPRLGERVGAAISGVLGPLVPKHVRAVRADAVAKALLGAALEARPGERVVENEEL